jgi:hypothetical protein
MIEVRRFYGVMASSMVAEKTDLLVTLSFPCPGRPCFLFVKTPFMHFYIALIDYHLGSLLVGTKIQMAIPGMYFVFC